MGWIFTVIISYVSFMFLMKHLKIHDGTRLKEKVVLQDNCWKGNFLNPRPRAEVDACCTSVYSDPGRAEPFA